MPGTAKLGTVGDEPPMMEIQGVPVIYADGPGAAEIHGEIVRVTYYELRTVGGVETRVPVLEMIRPRNSCGRGTLMALIERAMGDANSRLAH